jgi:hypothetical protein
VSALPVCTLESHAAIVADDTAWSALKPIGIQEVPAIDDEPGYELELRNCPCRSTLARRVRP